MAEANVELGRAVSEVLEWLDVSPDTAGAALGINGRTLAAMGQGIVPMRSLVIRFAQGLSRRCEGAECPSWWGDADAWLKLAGYLPRRDGVPAPAAAFGRDEPMESATDAGSLPASGRYRPVYERMPWGDTVVHIFWIMDRSDRKQYQMNTPAGEDYRARAQRLKQDLASLSCEQFERKYARYRLQQAEG